MNTKRAIALVGALGVIFLVLLLTGVLAKIIAYVFIGALGLAVLRGMSGSSGSARQPVTDANEYETISDALRAIERTSGWEGAEVTTLGPSERVTEPLWAAIETAGETEKAGDIDREIRAYKIIGDGPRRRVVALPTNEHQPLGVVLHITLPEPEVRAA